MHARFFAPNLMHIYWKQDLHLTCHLHSPFHCSEWPALSTCLINVLINVARFWKPSEEGRRTLSIFFFFSPPGNSSSYLYRVFYFAAYTSLSGFKLVEIKIKTTLLKLCFKKLYGSKYLNAFFKRIYSLLANVKTVLLKSLLKSPLFSFLKEK